MSCYCTFWGRRIAGKFRLGHVCDLVVRCGLLIGPESDGCVGAAAGAAVEVVKYEVEGERRRRRRVDEALAVEAAGEW